MNNPFDQQLFHWPLGNSSKCALRCTRTEFPDTYPITQLGLEFIRKLFTPELLRTKVKRIAFSGGVGDSLYNSELPKLS